MDEVNQFFQYRSQSHSNANNQGKDSINAKASAKHAGQLKPLEKPNENTGTKAQAKGTKMASSSYSLLAKPDTRFLDGLRPQYRKGQMMQHVDFSNPNQHLSRHASNLKNYYK